MIEKGIGCGRPECKVSTGICDRLTFGTGKLDFNGYWEFPCEECAREWERQHPDEECWPGKPIPVHAFCVDWNQ